MPKQEVDTKVSVIVLVYNEEAILARCLDALMSQTEPADEVVIVDNNSTDKSVEIAKRYPVKIVAEPKQGFIPARDTGFETAKHHIMVRLDADTVLKPDRIANVRQVFRENPEALAATGPVYYYDFPVIKKATFPFPGNPIYMKLIRQWPTLVGPNMAITKEGWNLVKGEVHRDDGLVHEDMDLSIHLRRYGRIVYDKRLVAETSARRVVKRPGSFFLEYPWRNLKTVWVHRQLKTRREGSKQDV